MQYNEIYHGIELFGIVVFAISGALVAARKRMDIFGCLVLGLVTAIGGGTLRDLLLNTDPVFWVADRIYLYLAVLASILTFAVVHHLPIPKQGLSVPRNAFFVSDAIGLAVFTLSGTANTLALTGSASLAVMMGVMSAVLGGMIRDVLSAEVPLVLRKEVYATASLAGAVIYVLLAKLNFGNTVLIAASLGVTLTIRLAAIRWSLSLPQVVSLSAPESRST